jgi:hypothetical protein
LEGDRAAHFDGSKENRAISPPAYPEKTEGMSSSERRAIDTQNREAFTAWWKAQPNGSWVKLPSGKTMQKGSPKKRTAKN